MAKKTKDSSSKAVKAYNKWGALCCPCAEAEGGTYPPKHICTVTTGTCLRCKTKKVTLIPLNDFDWPDWKPSWPGERD